MQKEPDELPPTPERLCAKSDVSQTKLRSLCFVECELPNPEEMHLRRSFLLDLEIEVTWIVQSSFCPAKNRLPLETKGQKNGFVPAVLGLIELNHKTFVNWSLEHSC